MHMESPRDRTGARNPKVPPGEVWELWPLQAEALCQVQQRLSFLFPRAPETVPDLELARQASQLPRLRARLPMAPEESAALVLC